MENTRTFWRMLGAAAIIGLAGLGMTACESALTGTVSISGTPQVGQVLTANIASLGGSGTIYFEWRAGGHVVSRANTFSPLTEHVGQTVTVTVTRTGYSGSVTSQAVGPVGTITWTAVPTGSPNTTAITFTFSSDPGSLVASDFTITYMSGSATRGGLSGSGTTRTLAISNASTGTVSVSINSTGIAPGPQAVALVITPTTLLITDVPTAVFNRTWNGFGRIRIFQPGQPGIGEAAVSHWGYVDFGDTVVIHFFNGDGSRWSGSGIFDVYWTTYTIRGLLNEAFRFSVNLSSGTATTPFNSGIRVTVAPP